jgi:hypothetical protein
MADFRDVLVFGSFDKTRSQAVTRPIDGSLIRADFDIVFDAVLPSYFELGYQV